MFIPLKVVCIGIDPYPNDRKKKTTEKRGWQGVSLGMAKGWQKGRLRIQMAASKLNWNWLDLGAEMTLSTKTLNSNHQVVSQDGLLLTYCKDPQRSAQIATEKSDSLASYLLLNVEKNPTDYQSHVLHGAGIFTYIWLIYGVNVGKYSSTMEHMGLEELPGKCGGLFKNSSNIMTWRSGFIYNTLW